MLDFVIMSATSLTYFAILTDIIRHITLDTLLTTIFASIKAVFIPEISRI